MFIRERKKNMCLQNKYLLGVLVLLSQSYYLIGAYPQQPYQPIYRNVSPIYATAAALPQVLQSQPTYPASSQQPAAQPIYYQQSQPQQPVYYTIMPSSAGLSQPAGASATYPQQLPTQPQQVYYYQPQQPLSSSSFASCPKASATPSSQRPFDEVINKAEYETYHVEPSITPAASAETSHVTYASATDYFQKGGRLPQSRTAIPLTTAPTAGQLKWSGPFNSAGILPYAVENGEILILLGHNSYRQSWEDFGGKREQNETPWQTARREFTEETKYAFPKLLEDPTIFYIQNGMRKPYFMFFVKVNYIPATTLNQNVRSGDEKTEFAWVRATDLYNAIINDYQSVQDVTGKNLNFYQWFKSTLKLNPGILQLIK